MEVAKAMNASVSFTLLVTIKLQFILPGTLEGQQVPQVGVQGVAGSSSLGMEFRVLSQCSDYPKSSVQRDIPKAGSRFSVCEAVFTFPQLPLPSASLRWARLGWAIRADGAREAGLAAATVHHALATRTWDNRRQPVIKGPRGRPGRSK